jgi:hypothetical protein
MSLARHLPDGYVVRRTTGSDARHVGARMRAVDRAEIEALEGRDACEFLADAVEHGAWTLTIGGEPVLLYGLVPCVDLPGHATPWLVTISTIGHDELMTVMWMSRVQIELWQRRTPVLEVLCDSRNSFRREWLEWLGFERGGHLAAFGAAGLPFDLYVRHRLGHGPASKRLH